MASCTAVFGQHPNPDTVNVDLTSLIANVSHWETYIHCDYRTAQGNLGPPYEQSVHGPVVTVGTLYYSDQFDVNGYDIAVAHFHSGFSQTSWYYRTVATMNDGTTQPYVSAAANWQS